MKKIFILLLFIPVFMSGQQVAPENQIIVIGASEIEFEPDWMELSMTARETENTRKESDVVLMENTILKYLLSLGMDSSCFSVVRYSANAKYSYSSGSKFSMSKSYILRINNLRLLDKIIDKCFEAGMDNVQVKRAGHSQMESFRNQALRDALVNARTKADIIAKTMDVALGKVIYVEENYYPAKMVDLDNLESYYKANYVFQDNIQSRAGSSLGYQKIVLSKTVLVKFGIQ